MSVWSFSGQEYFCSDTIGCLSPEIVDWSTVTRVICNSGKCNQSGYMHAECFSKYEDALVNFMSKQGRGRTWNDKQVRLEMGDRGQDGFIVRMFSCLAVRKYVEHQGLRYNFQEM